LLNEELVFFHELARQGRALSSEQRHQFALLQKRFEALTCRSDQMIEPLPATSRSFSGHCVGSRRD
jgi:hypothetical protein